MCYLQIIKDTMTENKVKEKLFFVEHMHKGSAKFIVLICCGFWVLGFFLLNVLFGILINSRPNNSDGEKI